MLIFLFQMKSSIINLLVRLKTTDGEENDIGQPSLYPGYNRERIILKRLEGKQHWNSVIADR